MNLAYDIAILRKVRCILIELALRKGDLAHYLDIAPRYTTTSLANEMHRVDSVVLQGALTEVADNLSVLVGPYEAIEHDGVNNTNVSQLIQLVRHMADVLVLDVPSTFDDLFFNTLTTADCVVLVTEQTVSSLRGAQLIVDALGQRHPFIVLNRYNPELRGMTIDRIAGFFEHCTLQDVASEADVIDSCIRERRLRTHNHNSPALDGIHSLVERLVQTSSTKTTETSKTTFLGRLSRVLSQS